MIDKLGGGDKGGQSHNRPPPPPPPPPPPQKKKKKKKKNERFWAKRWHSLGKNKSHRFYLHITYSSGGLCWL